MKTNNKTFSLTLIPLFSLLIAVCAWITVPAPVPFTMQTFSLFLCLYATGGKKTCAAIGIYIMLGLMGLPVFSGGGAGVGVVLGPTGGYMIGWIAAALIMWAGDRSTPRKTWVSIVLMLAGLACIYAVGTLWHAGVYAPRTDGVGVASTLALCVIPFVIPDLVKLALAILVGGRLRKVLTRALR